MAGRVDFSVNVFDRQIDNHGYYLSHQHAMRCPCLNLESGHPDPTCEFCTNGWQYYGEEEIKGIITSVASERQFLDTGGMLIGTMNLTVKASVELGYHDRITNKKSLIAYSELVTRGSGEADALRFTAIDILRVVGQLGVAYAPLADYEVFNGKIQWVGPTRPLEGSLYSVVYRMHPSWLVLSHLHIVRDTNIKFRQPAPAHHRLPMQALCKLEYLMD